jgi:hypothetical protein
MENNGDGLASIIIKIYFGDSTMVKKVAQADSPNREELFNLAVQAAKSGNRQGAKVMFMQILRDDRKNERVMMWLAKIATGKNERMQWLTRVLKVNPANETALAALAKIKHTDTANRNRMLLRVGTSAYVISVLVLATLIIILTFAG